MLDKHKHISEWIIVLLIQYHANKTPQVRLLNYWQTECYLCASRSPVVVLTAVLTAFSAIFVVHRRLSQPQCHGQRRSKTLSPKIQAKRKSIASPFLDFCCGTGNRSAFHNLSRMRSVALSQIVRFAVMNRLRWKLVSRCSWEFFCQLSRKGDTNTRIAFGERVWLERLDSAAVLKHWVTSSTDAENWFRSSRNDCPRPHVHNQNFSNYTFLVEFKKSNNSTNQNS